MGCPKIIFIGEHCFDKDECAAKVYFFISSYSNYKRENIRRLTKINRQLCPGWEEAPDKNEMLMQLSGTWQFTIAKH